MGMFARHRALIKSAQSVRVTGRVCQVRGLTITAASLPVPTGMLCRIELGGSEPIDAQVVGFSGDRTLLMPLAEPRGVTEGAFFLGTMRGSYRIANRRGSSARERPVGAGAWTRSAISGREPKSVYLSSTFQ